MRVNESLTELLDQYYFPYDYERKWFEEVSFPGYAYGSSIIYLIYFGAEVNIDFVLERFKKLGLRPANVLELLTLGVRYPNIVGENIRIFSLGIGRTGQPYYDCVPFIFRRKEGLSVGLQYFKNEPETDYYHNPPPPPGFARADAGRWFGPHCRFAVVKL